MKKLLITGGAGFIGSNFCHFLRKISPDYQITVLDSLTYAGTLENLNGIEKEIHFIRASLQSYTELTALVSNMDYIVHFAAESHVDNSIENGYPFVMTNVVGTFNLFRSCIDLPVKKIIYLSTDEVYGSRTTGFNNEADRLLPGNPYSATKAAGDLLSFAFINTYNLPIVIVRPSNNYGPRQYPEKLIPKLILNGSKNSPLTLYGCGTNVRNWLYVSDTANAIYTVMKKGVIGEIYNISSDEELSNYEVAKLILKKLNKSVNLIKFVKDRPGHDFRYGINSKKIRSLGWSSKIPFEQGLDRTISWYLK